MNTLHRHILIIIAISVALLTVFMLFTKPPQRQLIKTLNNTSRTSPAGTYELPLTFSDTTTPMMTLPVFVQDPNAQNTCTATLKKTYTVPKTTAVADVSLRILFSTELTSYGTYQSVSITGGVAQVMLTNNKTPGGAPISSLSSCQSGHLMSVLEDTLTQYPSIKKVELHSPEGKIEF